MAISSACQAPVKAQLVSRELIGILLVSTQAELSNTFKEKFLLGRPPSSSFRKWKILKFYSEQYAECSSSHRPRSKCFPRAFCTSDFVKYSQVVLVSFHSGEFCAGLSCTSGRQDPEALQRNASWTELSSIRHKKLRQIEGENTSISNRLKLEFIEKG